MTKCKSAAVAVVTVALGACVPAGGGVQTGPGPGGGGGVGPASQSPVANAREINQYLSNGSALIEYFEGTQWDGSFECGYFDANGSYESFWVDWSGEEDDFVGGWSVRGSRLCINGTWFSGSAHFGCNLAEWSLDDTLLLINSRDQIVAEITAYDGPQEYYQYGCGI